MATVVYGDFEWDSEKAATNVAKHGVTFAEAATAMADPNGVTIDDGSGTDRCTAIGMSNVARVLVVVHVERRERTRIISARKANGQERALYRDGG